MKKKAGLYQRDGLIIIFAEHRTATGLYLRADPVTACAAHDMAAVETNLLAAFDAYQEQVPHPTSWSNRLLPVFKLAKVRSYKAFMQGALSLQADLDNGIVTLTPTRNGGPREGFYSLPDNALTVNLAMESLGTGVLTAFARCQS